MNGIPEILWQSRSLSRYHGGRKPNCLKCGGSGMVSWPDGFTIKCPTCGGWGTRKCVACNSVGMVDTAAGAVPCEECAT